MDEEAGELVAYGFDDDERYRRGKSPAWAGRFPRRHTRTDQFNGHALRHRTDDPEDDVWELA